MKRDSAIAAAALGAAALIGFLVTRTAPGVMVGTGAGIVAAALIVIGRIKPLVAIPTVIGALAGGVIGAVVVDLLCAPSECRSLQITGAVLTGLGALIGIGVVVSLASRSLDEYHSAVAANRPPPEPGCETDQADASS